MGAGKTTLMAEASDVLIERGIVHAAIDLDTLGIGLLPPSENPDRISVLTASRGPLKI